MDKQRELNLTLAYTRDLVVEVHANDGKSFRWEAPEPLFMGDVQPIPIDLDPASLKPERHVVVNGNRVLVIGRDGPWELRPAGEVLTEIHDFVQSRVINSLKPFFVDLNSKSAD